MGYIKHRKMPYILSSIDFALLSLTNNLLNACKALTKLFEYIAIGLLVVASNVDEPTYMIRNVGNGIIVNDEKEMAKVMDGFVRNREFWRSKGMLGRKYLEERQNLDTSAGNLKNFSKL